MASLSVVLNLSRLLAARIARGCVVKSCWVSHRALEQAYDVQIMNDVMIDPGSKIGSFT